MATPARQRIEAAFSRWGHHIVRWRWPAIALCTALTLGLAWKLPEMRIDNSDENFLDRRAPARVAYDRFKDQFDREDRVLVLLEPSGPIFELDFLETLRELHRELEREVPYVAEVTSLVNARNTRGEGPELIVEDLMEDWPEDERDLAALRERVFANPLYVEVLIDEDGRYTVVSLEPFTYSTLGEEDALAGFDEDPEADRTQLYLTDEESFDLVESVFRVVERYRSPELGIHVVGGPTFDHHMAKMLQRDVKIFMSLSNAVVVVLLFVVFRRASGVLLPVVVVVSALAGAMGFMVWLDIPFSVTLNMLPAFLLVVGVCDSVHVLTIFYRRLAAGRSKEDAIADALGHSGLAVVMTSITTAAGLASFSIAEIEPIAQLGLLAPAGVMLAMINSLVLLPALLAVSPIRAVDTRSGDALRGVLDAFLARVGDWSTRHPLRVVGAAAVLVLLGVPGILGVRFSHDAMRWFPERDPMRSALELVDREFGGAAGIEVIVRTGEENGLYDPDTLARMERAMRFSETLEVDDRTVGKAMSIVDVVKETHQALNENRRDFYRLPDDRDLIAQELLLFENSGSDDLEELADSQLSTGRITLRTPWADAMQYPVMLERLRRGMDEILGEKAGYELTGIVVVFTSIFKKLILTMARSYVFALVVITPLMVLLIGHLQRGLVAMIPNLIPVYLVLALMGWADIPLDASTLLIGGVVIGLAVDDTIHFMHKFGRYYDDSGDATWAVHETLATTGSALLFTSLVLALGFAVFLPSYMMNTFWFGLLACAATIVAFLADILLAPALMVLVTGGRRAAATDPATRSAPRGAWPAARGRRA